MIPIILSTLGWAKKALTALLDLARRNPWQALTIALLVALAWQWHGKGQALDQRDAAIAGRAADRKAYIEAEAEAAALAMARLMAQEQFYKTKAKDADNAHDKELAVAGTAADRYIAANRVRCQAAGSSARQAAASSQGGGAAVPESPAAETELVAVTAADVRICTANYVYAKGAFDWANSLGK